MEVQQDPEPASRDERAAALALLQAPAVGMVVTALLSAMFWFLAIAGNVGAYFLAYGPRGVRDEEALGHGLGLLVSIFLLLLSLFMAFGAARMKNLRGYGLSIVTCVLISIPIVSFCCPLGMPFALWALYLLWRPDVRNAFR